MVLSSARHGPFGNGSGFSTSWRSGNYTARREQGNALFTPGLRVKSVFSGAGLTFDAGSGNALYELPLEEEKCHHEREARQHGGGHDLRVVNPVGALHGR
jgi:hypothetical protein